MFKNNVVKTVIHVLKYELKSKFEYTNILCETLGDVIVYERTCLHTRHFETNIVAIFYPCLVMCYVFIYLYTFYRG